MISDNPADDRSAHQQPVVAAEWPAGGSLLMLAFGRDLLGGPPPQFDDLGPVERPGRQGGPRRAQLVTGEGAATRANWFGQDLNPSGVTTLADGVEIGEQRYLIKTASGYRHFFHDQLLTSSVDRCRSVARRPPMSIRLRISGALSKRRCRGRPSDR